MKNFTFITVISVLFLSISPLSHADGNDLLGNCIKAEKFLDTQELGDGFDQGLCLGQVRGVMNSMLILGNGNIAVKACFPEKGLGYDQATRIVTAYLKKNPKLLHQSEEALIMMAYIDAFPCK
jgi:hypothetical protein